MKKTTKRIIACFSVVVVLVGAMAIPSFAYYDSQNTSLANRAYYSNFPIRFTRAVVSVDDAFNDLNQTYTASWISEVDLPTEYNTNMGNGNTYSQKQELINSATDSGTVSRGYATTYTTYYNDEFEARLGCNIHSAIVSESAHHRLDIYADVGIFTKEDLEQGFYISLYDVKNITRSRISFDLLIPTVKTIGIDDDVYSYVYNYKTVTIQCPLDDVGGDTYTYQLFTFDDIVQYFDSEQINFDEYPNTPIMITNVRYTAIFDRLSGGTNGSNYDFSFLLVYNGLSDSSLFDLNNLEIQMPIYPNYGDISFDDISVVDWAITQINSILRLELIPYISIGAILWFVVGLSLFFFTLKMFLGG